MLNSIELRTEYNEKAKVLEQLLTVSRYTLEQEIKRQKIPVHAIYGRIKSYNSFSKKVRAKKYVRPFKKIHDLLGLRVVCLFRSDIEKIKIIIRNTFDVTYEEDKMDSSAVEVFGYMGVHFDVRLKKHERPKTSAALKEIIFEIQVRTIGQDAWASVSHNLDYKQENAIPRHLKRELFALSGLFHVADTSFELLRKRTFGE